MVTSKLDSSSGQVAVDIYVAATATCPEDESSFDVTIEDQVQADELGDATECDSYTLPALTNGVYYTGPGGTGTMLNAGDEITTTQTIYIYVAATATCPEDESSFDVTIEDQVQADELGDATECDSYTLPALTNGVYYTGPGGTGTMLNAGDEITTTQTIYIYVAATATCPEDESSFDVTIEDQVQADELGDATECDSYTLPALTNGVYYTGPGGTGTMLNAGDEITTTQTIYIYVAATATCPEDESSFDVTIEDQVQADELGDATECDSYTLPALTNGVYYTGPGGTGTMLNAGDEITTTQTIYIYVAATATCPEDESSFDVTIEDQVQADELGDATECDSYTLPALTNGVYYTGPGGTGTMLNAGDEITTTQTIYIYVAATATCPEDESSFDVTIEDQVQADELGDATECDSYTLPALTNGVYYTGPGGTGTMLNAGDEITTTQTIYIYVAATATCPEDESSFDVTIEDQVQADELGDATECDSYTLPALTNGVYYTGPGGTGTMLNAGDEITTTQTIYIYVAATATCPEDESSFDVTIEDQVQADELGDATECDSYTLPALTNGVYYTGPGGTGTMLNAGDEITTTQTIYIYVAATATCPEDESSFDVTIEDQVQADELGDATECDSYTLPALTNGVYYTGPGGTGTMLNAGDEITTTQTIYIYVAATATCPEDESSFDVTIEDQVQADELGDATECDSYTLPALTNGVYYTGPGGTGTMLNAGDEITTTQTIYIYVAATATCPEDESSFDVTIEDQVQADELGDATECDSYTLPALTNGVYYTGPGGTGTMLNAGDEITTTQTIYIYVAATATCPEDESSFDVTIEDQVQADELGDATECDSYTLPALTNGVYYTGPGGTGTMLNAGDEITTTQTIYIYVAATATCPEDESSFDVTIEDQVQADELGDATECDSYTLPALTNGVYYTGPGGTGTMLNAGDEITTTQTIYIYVAATATCPEDESSFDVTIEDQVQADELGDATECDSYTLPALTNGVYYTGPGGTGTMLNAGDEITTTQTIYIYVAATATCPEDESSFDVTIEDQVQADELGDATECDSYTLPALTNGVYYTGPGGTGTMLNAGDEITTTQTIYIYVAATATCPEDESSFDVTIEDQVQADELGDATECDSYTLPALTNGVYYTGPGGTGTMLNAGDEITTTQTIYIYVAATATCPEDESSFDVTIEDQVQADELGDATECDSYTLPALTNGVYYTGPGGTGTMLNAGDEITTTQTIYIYVAATATCPEDESSFDVTIEDQVQADELGDATECDSYTLPALTNGVYYTGPGGTGTMLNAGDEITTTQTIYIYVAATATCPEDESSFDVTIEDQVQADELGDATECDSYTLPALTNGVYYTGPGGTGTMLNAGDEITTTQTIYIYVAATATCPEDESSFDVTIEDQVQADELGDATECDSYTLPALTNGVYYTGPGGTGTMLNAGDEITTTQTIYIYVAATATCPEDESSFDVTIEDQVQADELGDATECDSYTLPALTNGVYYTGPGGTGTMLNAGDEITTTQTIYIYVAATATCPEDESSFDVTIEDQVQADELGDATECDSYTLPALTNGVYYTGPGGTGTMLNAGDEITTTQTIYIYVAATATCPEDESSFDVTIEDQVQADELGDATECDSYTLPALTNGVYYTGPGGTGTMLNAGDEITTTQTIYIYVAATATCPEDESSFDVTIEDQVQADELGDATECDSYTLPALTNGVYYTGPGGTGTMLNAGDEITTTQTIYIYVAATATCPEDESSFDVTIEDQVQADELGDATECDSYTLPALTNGVYYTGPGGTGTMLNAGDEITTTQTIYIYVAATATCPEDESSFDVTIEDQVQADELGDATECDSYTLPALTNGVYYTGPGGTGTMLNAGDEITTTQTIYIYVAATATCPEDESSFDVTIEDQVQADELGDATECDSYTLPALTNGVYYTGPGGTGTMLNAGDEITTTQTIYIYVAATATCPEDESSFDVTIEDQVQADELGDATECDSYTLPALTNGVYYTGPGGTGTMLNAGDEITTTQTIYIYVAATATCPEDESSFDVTIEDQVQADELGDATECDSYTLPALTNGVYYTGPGGTGTMLNAGDEITTTQTIYIYVAATATCPEDESSFDVTIEDQVQADELGDATECDSYTLPALTNGVYYTGPGGTGTMLNAGDEITTTQTISAT